MSKKTERFFPELKAEGLRKQVEALREKLAAAKTLEVHPNEHGIYAASASQSEDATSGYQNAWLRDNAMVAHARFACGDAESAMRTARGLTTFLKTQAEKMERIIAKPKRKEEVQERPHIRFNAKTLKENEESWAHAQNDALGEALWLRFLLANGGANGAEFALDAEERELWALFPAYFEAIQYWKDADSGAWEEARKVNSSSIGAVLAGLREMDKHVREGNELEGVKKSVLAELWKRGQRVLEVQLPFEAPPERKTDAALLLLIYPLNVVNDGRMKELMASLVRARLMGETGIRRYAGDSYFCQDYDRWFPPEERSADFAQRLAVRDEFLQPGCEAQWCLFDPLLSVIYGQRYEESGHATDLELQLEHANRAIGQLDEGRCAELYFLKQGKWTANEHTPLAWTQANLAVAMECLERSARKPE
ncbi:MAG TPA: glycoside hydrolase family 15 protein [Candidatus Acidoferrum sp.]|nr:glycoside hydrolase family 15 protein [Candidatus Acidoferrum sp.]